MAKREKKKQFQLQCMYCDEPGGSREHYFSSWMHEYFKHLPTRISPSRSQTVLDRRTGSVTTTSDDRSTGRSRVHDPIKRVCIACNNNWMGDIVKRAQPSLECWALPSGQLRSKAISKEDLAAMATWATLTAITYVSDLTISDVTQFDRDYIRQNGRPPPFWSVSIARLRSPTDHALISHRSLRGRDQTRMHEAIYAGPWVVFSLIDLIFFVQRCGRRTVPFSEAANVVRLKEIHPAPFRAVKWDSLQIQTGDIRKLMQTLFDEISIGSAARMEAAERYLKR